MQGSGPQPYTECGIGAALFKNTAWAAAISNVTWDLGTTAVISALASPETCNAKKVETARLILETLPSLEQDIALGNGSHLVALNDTMACQQGVRAEMNGELRSAYASVVGADNYAAQSRLERATGLYATVKDVVEAHPGNCNISL